MRTLKFIVEGQTISKDPECDFSRIVRGSKGYLRAEFSFDEEWSGCRKAVVFTNMSGEESYAPIINGACEIPEEVLENRTFFVKVVGERVNFSISTNKERVMQDG